MLSSVVHLFLFPCSVLFFLAVPGVLQSVGLTVERWGVIVDVAVSSPENVSGGVGLTGGTDVTPTPFLCPDSISRVAGEEGTGDVDEFVIFIPICLHTRPQEIKDCSAKDP